MTATGPMTIGIDFGTTNTVVALSDADGAAHLAVFEAPDGPTATFRSTKVVVNGQEAKITGDLTLRGVTKPVTLDVDFHGAGMGMNKKETVGFQAETTIKRSDFGIAYGIPMVSDAVELEIHAAFEKQ